MNIIFGYTQNDITRFIYKIFLMWMWLFFDVTNPSDRNER